MALGDQVFCVKYRSTTPLTESFAQELDKAFLIAHNFNCLQVCPSPAKPKAMSADPIPTTHPSPFVAWLVRGDVSQEDMEVDRERWSGCLRADRRDPLVPNRNSGSGNSAPRPVARARASACFADQRWGVRSMGRPRPNGFWDVFGLFYLWKVSQF